MINFIGLTLQTKTNEEINHYRVNSSIHTLGYKEQDLNPKANSKKLSDKIFKTESIVTEPCFQAFTFYFITFLITKKLLCQFKRKE